MSDLTPHPRISEFSPKPRQVAAKLPEQHEASFEAQMREHFEIQADRDHLRHELSDLKTKLAATEAAMTMLEANVTASESRVISYQLERDKAVADRVQWEVLFASIYAQLKAFKPPEKPLVAQEE